MSLKIRKAKQSDLDVLVELNESLQSHLECSNARLWRKTEQWWRHWREKLLELLSDENTLYLVAEINGEVIGYVYGTVDYRTDYLPKTIGTIASLHTHEDFRRQSVGCKLVKRLCEFFKTKNVENVYLSYVTGNREAENFWNKLGFQNIMIIADSTIGDILKRLTEMHS
jgi:ribosomal protein S18 acetylase RimI-like enzyme